MAARSSEAFTAATPQSSPATNHPLLRAVRHRHLRPGFGTLTFEIATGCHGKGGQERQRLELLERLVKTGLPVVCSRLHPSLTQQAGKKFQLSQPAIRIPPTVDSLNVTSAPSVFLGEANRQRGLMWLVIGIAATRVQLRGKSLSTCPKVG